MQKGMSSSEDTPAQLETSPAIWVGFCLHIPPLPLSDGLALSFQVKEGVLGMEACLLLLQDTQRKDAMKPGKPGTPNVKGGTCL